MYYLAKYLTLKDVNEMLENPTCSSIFGQLIERRKELWEYRRKKSIERGEEEIRLARERGTLIESPEQIEELKNNITKVTEVFNQEEYDRKIKTGELLF